MQARSGGDLRDGLHSLRRERGGETARAGGWGWRLGDEGSGYDIGHRALIAALRDHDGRGPATLLTESIRGALSLGTIDELVDLTYRGNMVIDAVARRLASEPFDRDGRIAAKGTVDQVLLDELLSHPYFTRIPPKTTGEKSSGNRMRRSI